MSLVLEVFCGCLLLIFKTEEHKNKRFIECSNVCSSELDIPLSFQCYASSMLSSQLLFCLEKNKSNECLFLFFLFLIRMCFIR